MIQAKQLRIALLAITTAISPFAQAIDLDAGDYDTAPAGTTAGLLYLQHAERGSLYSGSDKVAGHNELDSNIGIARLVHYTDISGILTLPQILLPFGQLKGKDDASGLGKASGFGDAILAIPTWLVNDTVNHTYFAIAPYLYLPTGNYDRNKALNLGENRYKGTLQVAYSTRLTPDIAWDVAGDVTVYGDNSDAVGGTLKQDLGYQLQTNARYFLSPKADLRAGISYADAGETKQNGIKSDATTQSKFWLGSAFWVAPKTQFILTYGRDIKVENGFKEDNRLNFRLLQIF
ncbi:transporter [Aquirhabdus parva]|uniref:Transporter n=1 Tax=Aquirhabdus parva TaxID=2283318 RepID=A0A345P4L7_9GAMM|nr:transporter [Aquirhabdus parva]AXI02226.1 transporter [Aquirhabdus parva]